MQGLQTARFDGCSTFLARSVQALVEAPQSFVDGSQLLQGRIVDHVQGLVVLQLDSAVAPIADQRIVATLKVPGYAGVALCQSVTSGSELLFDQADVLLLS